MGEFSRKIRRGNELFDKIFGAYKQLKIDYKASKAVIFNNACFGNLRADVIGALDSIFAMNTNTDNKEEEDASEIDLYYSVCSPAILAALIKDRGDTMARDENDIECFDFYMRCMSSAKEQNEWEAQKVKCVSAALDKKLNKMKKKKVIVGKVKDWKAMLVADSVGTF